MKVETNKLTFWQHFDKLTKNTWVIAFMLIVIAVVVNIYYDSIFDKKIDLGGDSVAYYTLGQALSHGEGYTNIYLCDKTPHTHFPPGYPRFISRLIKIFPENILTVKRANGALLSGSMILLFFVIFLTTSNSILAFCTCFLASMHRDLLRYATIMMSETLYLFLSLVAILIAVMIVKNVIGAKRKWPFWLFTVLYFNIIIFTYYVRTMSLALILSLIAWLGIIAIRELVKKRKQQFVKCIVLCAATVIAVGTAKMAWDARNRDLGKTSNDYQATFFKKNNNEDMEGKEDWKIRIKSNTSNFITCWVPEVTYMKAKTFNPQSGENLEITTKEWVCGILLLCLIIAGALYISTGKLLMLFYLAFTVGILILYPEQYGGTRYITPLIPLFIFLALNGIMAIVALLHRLFKVSHSPLFVQSIVVILCTFVFLYPKYAQAKEETKNAARLKSWTMLPDDPPTNINIKRFIEAARYCGDSLPEDARIVSRKPELFYFFSNQHPCNGFPKYGDPDTIYNKLCRDSIEYLVIDNWYRHAYVTLAPCVTKYEEKFKIVKRYGEDPTCPEDNNPTYILQFNDFWGYHGELKDGIREGQGVLNLQDGRTYKGTFANGLPNGLGTLYDSIGNEIVTGNWKDGTIFYPIKQ